MTAAPHRQFRPPLSLLAVVLALALAFPFAARGAVPTVVAPADGASVTARSNSIQVTTSGGSPEVIWSVSPAVDGNGQLVTRTGSRYLESAGSTGWQGSFVPALSFTVTQPGTYYWQVLGFDCSGPFPGCVQPSPVRTVHILSPPPPMPALPTDGARFTFDWRATMRLEFAAEPGSSWLDLSVRVSRSPAVDGTGRISSDLSALPIDEIAPGSYVSLLALSGASPGTYYWQPGWGSGAAGSVRSFELVAPAPPAPSPPAAAVAPNGSAVRSGYYFVSRRLVRQRCGRTGAGRPRFCWRVKYAVRWVAAAPPARIPLAGYGAISEVTGRPRIYWVSGYYRRNGTSVRGYWRSCSRCTS